MAVAHSHGAAAFVPSAKMPHQSDQPLHRCGLCNRLVSAITRHHLVPRSRTRKRKRRRQLEAGAGSQPGTDHVKGRDRPAASTTIGLCRACHNMVHAVLTEKQLESDYHTRESLLAHPQIAQFVKWAARQDPNRRIAVHRTRARRRQ